MHHMARILREEEDGRLEKIASETESFLVKVASAFALEMEKEGRFLRPFRSHDDLETIFQVPDNPLLGALRFQLEQAPPAGMMEMKEQLAQILNLDLQNAMSKLQFKALMQPIHSERDRLRAMADIMRERLEVARHLRELQDLQQEVAAQTGMMPNNVAVQAAGAPPGAQEFMEAPGGPPPEAAPAGPAPGMPPAQATPPGIQPPMQAG